MRKVGQYIYKYIELNGFSGEVKENIIMSYSLIKFQQSLTIWGIAAELSRFLNQISGSSVGVNAYRT